MTGALVALALALPGQDAGAYLAQREWGTPACGTPSVEVSTPEQYQQQHGTGYFDGDPFAWADEKRCAIVLNPRYQIRTAVKRCHVIVHEWGHLAGEAHTDRGVMASEDAVTEGRVRVKKRWEWRASGAFRPCYEYTKPGYVFG